MPSETSLSVMKKYLMSIWRDYIPASALPFFSNLIALMLSSANVLVVMWCPWASRNSFYQMLLGIYSLAPTSSASWNLHQPVPLQWNAWYSVSVLWTCITAHQSPLTLLLRCGFSCSRGRNKMRQPTYGCC
jgi:hypothetical protein